MNSRAGEDLSWWWRGWYVLRSASLDLVVNRAVPVAGEPRRLHLELANHGRLVMAAVLELRQEPGGAQRITLLVEAWRQSSVLSIDVPVPGDIKAGCARPRSQ